MTPAAYERLIGYLRRLYGVDLFTHRSVAYPVAVFQPAPGQVNGIDDLLGPGVPADAPDAAAFPIYDHAYLERLRASGRTLTNNAAYIFDRLERENGAFRLHAHLGMYFDMMATCAALDDELQRYAQRGGQLPLRTRLHTYIAPAQALESGAGRAAILGIAVLTVFNHDGVYQAVLGQRSSALATDPGRLHVLPAFVFQPSGPQRFYPAEWNITRQIQREFGEELFNMPEFADWPGVESPDYFYHYPPVADLRAMLADGRAVLHPTGLAVNLLTLRPEICALLVIHDPGWHRRWRETLAAASQTERQRTIFAPVQRDQDAALNRILGDDFHLRAVPQGAVCLWLGILKARSLL